MNLKQESSSEKYNQYPSRLDVGSNPTIVTLYLDCRTSKVKESNMDQIQEANLDERTDNEVAAPLYDGCTCLVCGKVF